MIIVTPRPKTVECWNCVPNQVAVTQAAAFFEVDGHPKLLPGAFPEFEQAVGCGVARPRTALGENLRVDLAGVSINRTLHLACAIQAEHRSFRMLEDFRGERAELPFGNRFVRD